ncbi:MAG: glutathione S-transferase family protein [Alphaproteobacteria bacterium]
MITLYSQQDSGNCYKPRLLMAYLDIPFRIVDINTLDGSMKNPEFLARNPIGKVPLVEFADGRFLAESNAILLHLAEGSRLLPADPYERAIAYKWLFFEQYSHEPTIAVRRSLTIYPERSDRADAATMARLLDAGNGALAVMEERLGSHDWLAGGAMSVADIALYAYTHMAGEGGFDLTPYPGISAWIARISATPGHVSIDWRPGAD